MAKEHFSIAGSKDILSLVENAGQKSGIGRGQAFEDFLTLVLCSLAGQTMEEEYLKTVRKGYDKGTKGKRGIDIIVKAFAELVNLMTDTGQDVLGDIFQGGITYGEAGQYFTPEPLTSLMAELTSGQDQTGETKSVCDPACGSGRILLDIGKRHPSWEFTGQDVDHRCAQMTAINLGLFGLRGYAVWQNTLTLDVHRVYRIGFNLNAGVIREIPVEQSPFNDRQAQTHNQKKQSEPLIRPPPDPDDVPRQQLDLF